MKNLVVICTLFSAMMSWPVVSHAQETKKADSKEVCRHENYGSNPQSRIVEKACMSKNTSSLERSVANAVSRGTNDKVSSSGSNNSSKNSNSGSSSQSKSSSSSGSTSSSSNSSGSSSSGSSSNSKNDSSSNSSSSNSNSCSTCSERANALINKTN